MNIELTPHVKRRLTTAKRKGLCVACMEPLYGRVIRGTHEKCYKTSLRAIHAGTWTEEQRIAEGKLLVKDPGGRPRSNPVALEEIEE